MNFWDLENANENKAHPIAIDHGGGAVSHAQLIERISQYEMALDALGARTFGILLCANRLDDIALYLACLRRRHVPLLLATDTPAQQLEALCARYQPQWIMGSREQGQSLLKPLPQTGKSYADLHPKLGLLLSTSGSTGSPRLVRLSREALQANAWSIMTYMGLSESERAITSLPMHYSYGLSVINSHLLANACLVLNNISVVQSKFIECIRNHEVTSLAGVPYVYQMLFRVGFFRQKLPCLRTLTQAGGKMGGDLTKQILAHTQIQGQRLFVMYGQTEACARISYVPPQRLADKIGSIGVAIPGGKLSLHPQTQELLYSGPNVMLGYAQQREDLALGDVQQGQLATGDLGRMDEDGFFFIEGRLKRFIKVCGNRISLDEVEQALEAMLNVAVSVSGQDDAMVVWVESAEPDMLERIRTYVREQFSIHHKMMHLQLVDALPLLSTGKKDYSILLGAS